MLRKLLAVACFALLGWSPSYAQNLNPVTPLVAGAPVGSSNPMPVSGTFSATLSGFTPGLTFATLTATGSSASVALPAGTTVFFQNNGTTTVSCTLGVGSATATANEILVPASSGVPVVVGSNTWGACIDQSGTASNLVVLAGGSGLGNAFGGGSSGGGGGAITAAANSYAVGAFQAGTGADGWDATQGAKTDAACTGDATSGCSVQARLQRIAQDIATLNTTAGNPLAGQTGNVWIGNVGDLIVTPSANFTRPAPAAGATVAAYASGQLVANSATAGSVVPLSWTASRIVAGNVYIRRVRMADSSKSITNTSFRVHFYTVSPTIANGDGAAWSTNLANYVCRMDVTLGEAGTDQSQGFGVPTSGDGNECNIVAAGGTQLIYGLVEARAAYQPIANAASATLGAGGSTYTTGAQVLTLTGGTCTTFPSFNVTVASGAVTTINSVANAGACTVTPSNPAATSGGGGTGATLNVTWASDTVTVIPEIHQN